MTTKRMKSREVRDNWRETLRYVEDGGAIVVEHYTRTVARIIPDDDTIVVLRIPDAVQAERLRHLVREHGAVSIPFPNNITGWRVVDENGQPVNPHAIPSVQAGIVSSEEPSMTSQTSRYIEDYKHRDLIGVAIGIAADSQYARPGEYFAPTTREGLTKPMRGLLDDGLIELVPIPGRDDRALLQLTSQGKAKVRELDVAEVDEAIAAHNRERPEAGQYKVTGAEVLAYHA